MPLFSSLLGRRRDADTEELNAGNGTHPDPSARDRGIPDRHHRNAPPSPPPSKLVFHCQQAQGSPTGIISGFTNIKELYSKIADCYDIPVSEVRQHRETAPHLTVLSAKSTSAGDVESIS
ncbi:PDZ domain-containing protein GIPC1-like [Tropilaelaps mercedesae]|uniref:PDZ domain-containing protein GIPC1-like n=1 Tax=Tropilaelaps mercedesae TaxID=418985 RepID=A0A1V9XDH8_9ACAR|nr:PDZ domain-containing protein GIPC1-like [Tropilaelaps mercedesae]